MSPDLEAATLAAGTVLTAGVIGSAFVWVVARRRPQVAAVLAPVVLLAAMGSGVLVTTRAMFLSKHDFGVVVIVLAAALPVAIGLGIWLSSTVRRLTQHAAEQRAAADAAAEVEGARRDLVAGVSHDLRTPLAGIRAMAESLEDGVAKDPAHYLSRIRAEVDRMDAMVGSLLDLSRLQSGAQHLRRETVDLHDVVSDSVASARLVGERGGVSVTGAASRPLLVTGDPELLGRALGNLLSNGLRHTPEGGAVDVSALMHPGTSSCSITVTDGCGGIAPETLRKVFDVGFRGESARTPNAGASAGLGLALVREVATAHGGSVSVSNVAAGCRFTLTLPADPS
jgi:signal transduction histidine kinase